VLNIVYGVNDHLYDHSKDNVVTAASCTTNCLAPVVKVLLDKVGIKHGSMTTMHCLTNTQCVIDSAWAADKEIRRSRSCGSNLVPTTTGSATAIAGKKPKAACIFALLSHHIAVYYYITEIFPQMKGKLNGHAVRVPLANASITDCVFEMEREITRYLLINMKL